MQFKMEFDVGYSFRKDLTSEGIHLSGTWFHIEFTGENVPNALGQNFITWSDLLVDRNEVTWHFRINKSQYIESLVCRASSRRRN